MFETPDKSVQNKAGDQDEDDEVEDGFEDESEEETQTSVPNRVSVRPRRKTFIMKNEKEARYKLNEVSRALARVTKLKPKIVQCQNLLRTYNGFTCKV